MLLFKLEKGALLLSNPAMDLGDDVFSKSVILLADHNLEGSVGFILNKPLNFFLRDLVPDLNVNFKIYNGGPVAQDNLYFIHNVPALIPESVEIANGIYWGGDFEMISKLILSKKISQENIRFFLGYSGWTAGQLDAEMQDNSWVISQNTLGNHILRESVNKFYKNKLIELGGDYLIFANSPSDPMLN